MKAVLRKACSSQLIISIMRPSPLNAGDFSKPTLLLQAYARFGHIVHDLHAEHRWRGGRPSITLRITIDRHHGDIERAIGWRNKYHRFILSRDVDGRQASASMPGVILVPV